MQASFNKKKYFKQISCVLELKSPILAFSGAFSASFAANSNEFMFIYE